MPPAWPTCSASRSSTSTAAEYKDRVFAEFLREYQAGARPTLRRAVQRRDQVQGLPGPRHAPGRRKIATGHYARAPNQATGLFAAAQGGWTNSKDQSYFSTPEPGPAGQNTVPRGRAAQDRGAPHCREIGLPNAKKKARPASASWRAAVSRVSEPLHLKGPAPSRRPGAQAGPARGPVVLPPWANARPGHWRREGRAPRAVRASTSPGSWRARVDKTLLRVVQGA